MPSKQGSCLTIIFCCLFIVALMFLSGSSAFAQRDKRAGEKTRIKIGALEVHGALKVDQMYDDNVFLENTNEQHDWITRVTPGVQFVLPFRDHSIDIGYVAELSVFSDNSQENYQNQYLNAGANLNFAGGLFFEARDIYNDTYDPSSSAEQATLDPRTRKKINTASSILGYDISEKTSLEFNFSHYSIDYVKTSLNNLDRKEIKGGGTGFYKFWPKTAALVAFNYGSSEYDINTPTDPQDDSDYYDVRTGLRFDPDAKLTGEVRVGYEDRDFDTAKDVDGLVFSAALTWFATPKITARTSFYRELEMSTTNADTYLWANAFSIGATNKFTDKLYASVDGTYNLNDYNTTREDDYFDGILEIGYYLKEWVNLYVRYERLDNDSNQDVNDYIDNRFSFGIAMNY